jgi:hypothetical protein
LQAPNAACHFLHTSACDQLMKIAKQAFIKERQDYAARFGVSSERFAGTF